MPESTRILASPTHSSHVPAMTRRGAVAELLGLPVVAAVAATVDDGLGGRLGAAGSAVLGVVTATVFFAVGMLTLHVALRRATTFSLVAALSVFVLQVLLLAGLFDLGRGTGWFSRASYAGGVLAGTAIWQVATTWVHMRRRQSVYDA